MSATEAAAPLVAIFARKPCTLEDACFSGRPERIRIEDRRELTADEYDAFAEDLTRSRGWLSDKGGRIAGATQVVEVTAPGRKTLYVNPEGSDYARYVGIAW
jgi:hypothetical protein